MSFENIKKFAELKRRQEAEYLEMMRELSYKQQTEMSNLIESLEDPTMDDTPENPSTHLRAISYPNLHFDFEGRCKVEYNHEEDWIVDFLKEHPELEEEKDICFLVAQISEWDNGEADLHKPHGFMWDTILRKEESSSMYLDKIVVVAWAVLDLDIKPAWGDIPACKFVRDIKEVWKGYNFARLLLERLSSDEYKLVPSKVTAENCAFWKDYLFGPVRTTPGAYLDDDDDVREWEITDIAECLDVPLDDYKRINSLDLCELSIIPPKDPAYIEEFISKMKPNDSWNMLRP